jgi:hypothetical protein
MTNTYRIWVSRKKETTIIEREFANAFAAKLWMASRMGLKTFNIVAQKVSKEELVLRAQAAADPSSAGKCYRHGTLTLKQYRSIYAKTIDDDLAAYTDFMDQVI